MSLISAIKSILGLGGSDRAEGTTVTVERDTIVDAETDTDESADASEPSTSVDDTTVETGSESEEATDEAGADEPEDSADTDGAPEVEAEGEPVETITGIGPAYAERLANAGIESVAELAAADAAELADETDIAQARIEDWIERAASS